MILRCVCCSILLYVVLEQTVKAEVTVDEKGYQNVLISFAPNIPSKNGKETVEKIQDLLKSTSNVLHTATGLPISSATFLLPPSWPTDTWEDINVNPASSEQVETKPDIRVDATEQSAFGKKPVTLQYGGCGVAGHQITLPLDFVSSTEEYPKGKQLAREWLKYRYGVFDEHGYPGDPFYPDYYRIPGSMDIRIHECTNSEVTYIFRKPTPGDVRVCKMNSVAGDFGYCRAHPDEKSAANVTSSLMYFHKDLINMEHICGKDGRPHHSTARNKQNALCNGRSIWDVIKSSKDFKKTQNQPAKSIPKSIQFSYIQESKPRFVVLLENSDNLFEKGKSILFALRRFYYDLPLKSKLAIYTYNRDVTDALPFIELSAKERSNLDAIADFGFPATTICTSCGLEKAAQILLQDSEVEKGTILLITASSLDKIPDFSQKLIESGICLHVFRFTDKDNPDDQTYDSLASSFHCFSQESLQMSMDAVDVFHGLSRFLKSHVPEYNDNFEIKTVATGNMSAEIPLTIPKDASAENYTLWLRETLGSSSIECKAGENLVMLKSGVTGTEISSFTFAPVDDDVTCRLGSAKLPSIPTQVQMTTRKKHDIIFDIWIHDASTNKEQLPIIIYAKIYSEGYPVKYANVTTVVKSEENPKISEIVKMFDNGHGGPDVTQGDGIYSGYFSNFLTAGKYLISVRIEDNNGEARIGKGYPLILDTCCGSKVYSEDHDIAVPTFKKEKHTMYAAKNKSPEDGYPPSRILDLFAWIFQISTKVTLIWTTPGGAARYSLKLFLNREDAVSNFDTTGRDIKISNIESGDIGKPLRFDIPLKDLDENVTYYAAIRSWNEFNKSSEISNIAEFIIPKPLDVTSTTPGSTTDGETIKPNPPQNSNKTIGIVLGVLGGLAVICVLVYLAYYFFVKKPRRN
ncbi:unnamed protein product [Larinioides sclopetarius]|uniref:Calcium-activated chloride channel N-terminal domain-containing protein n=1 Tax=Larinioides sclopetarius TaxID=280406 RepID=A0AAV2BMP1_9ARAC